MSAQFRLRPLVVAMLAGTWLLTGCSTGPDLAGRSFVGDEVTGHALVTGSAVQVTFDDGRISASAGCNTMTAPADWSRGSLELTGEMAITLKGCEDDLQAQDEWLSSFLSAEPTLHLADATLVLETTDVRLSLNERE